MAVTLAQAAALEPSPLRRGTLEMFSQVSTVFDRLPIEPINGAAYAYAKDKVLPGTAFRTVNEAYIESTGLVNQDTESLVILGGEAHVDTFIERTMDSSPDVLLANQTRMKVESLQATFVDTMFNGDVAVDPKGFDGLRKRLIGQQVIDSAAPTNSEGFLDELDELFGRVQGGVPDVVYAPQTAIAKLKSLAARSAVPTTSTPRSPASASSPGTACRSWIRASTGPVAPSCRHPPRPVPTSTP